MLHKDDFLRATGNGLDIFRHYIPGNWVVKKPFLNPLYDDTKASCYIYMNKERRYVMLYIIIEKWAK